MDSPPRNHFSTVKPSPRVALAATLYGSGAAKTKTEASKMAGLFPQYLNMLTAAGNPEVHRIITESQRRVLDNSIDTTQILQELGRKALATIVGVMEASGNEALKLKAAVDLADRSPETSKIARAAVTTLTLDGEDVQRLAQALVRSASVRSQYQSLAEGDFVKVDTSVATALPPTEPK